MGSHAGFIIAAFCLTAVVVAGMILVLVADHRALRRDLARYDDRGPEADG